jgi:hypothetical protein
MATGAGVAYRMGFKTIGLTAEAGVPVRFRKFVVDDTFATGEENCTAALTVGQYATVGTAGKWVPAAEAPSTAGWLLASTLCLRALTANLRTMVCRLTCCASWLTN